MQVLPVVGGRSHIYNKLLNDGIFVKQELAVAAVALSLLFVAGEGFARLYLGLGDPPLTVIDSKIEYLFAPNQDNYRFGKHIHYNSKSMRSSEPPPNDDSETKRVLVLGDSVVNGGVLIDQRDLATEIVSQDLKGKYWIGNVSAGSWGPANIHAYLDRFGWFRADTAILIISTHDLRDLPEFRSGYGDDFPTEKPISALWEGITRYLPRYLPQLRSILGNPIRDPTVQYSDLDRERLGAQELRHLLEDAKKNVAKVVVMIRRP